jgi:YHS domain-containing protein/thioredoxin-related protein
MLAIGKTRPSCNSVATDKGTAVLRAEIHQMRTWTMLCVIGLAGAATRAAGPADDRAKTAWHHDYELALAEARLMGQPLLVHVTAKWCPGCLRLERTTFPDPRVVDYLRSSYVAVHVDADRSPELIARFSVERLPTAVVITPDGIEQGRIVGYRKPEDYITELTRLIGPWQRIASSAASDRPGVRTAAVANSATENPSGKTMHAGFFSRTVRPPRVVLSVELESSLMLDGYCAVTMVETKKLVAGSPEHRAEYDGQTYWFIGAAEADRFRNDPARYAPLLGGLCVAAQVDEARQTPGTARCAAVYRDRLYLFAGKEERQQFLANPKHYLDCDLVNAGQCPVCRVTRGESIDGNRDVRHVLNGRMFWFDSPEHQRAFVDNHEQYVAFEP